MSLLSALQVKRLPPALRERLDRWRADRMSFRREAVIMEDGSRFVPEPWQAEDFALLDSGEAANTYLERPRGHSKTFDLAVEAALELVIGAPGQRMFCAAADLDQATILFEDVAGILRRNPLLLPLCEIQAKSIRCKLTGSRLQPLASDVPGSWGLRPDLILIDELCQWPEKGRQLWEALFTASGKRSNCRTLIISTPGFDKSGFAFGVREMAGSESDWVLSSRGPCASWIKPSWLEQQRRQLPAHVFERLHGGRWTEGGAFLSQEEIDAVFTDLPSGAAGKAAAGLDLGLTRDRSVFAVCSSRNGIVCVDKMHTWMPKRGEKVDLQEVEEDVAVMLSRAGVPLHVDPYQAVLLMQRLRTRGLDVKEYVFTGEGRRKLFGVVLDLIRNRKLRSPPHDELRRELLGLEVVESASGWKVDHRVGRHDDHVVALALAAQAVAGGTQEIQLSDWMDLRLKSREEILATAVQRFENSATLELVPWSTNSVAASPLETEEELRYKARKLAEHNARRGISR